MIKRLLRVAVVVMGMVAVMGGGGCAAPKSYFEYDPKADFAALKTFAIEPNDQLLLTARERLLGVNLRGTIASAIEQDLRAKGYQAAAAPGKADFLVRYEVAIEQAASDVGGGGSTRRDVTEQAAAGNNPYVPMGSSQDAGAFDANRTGSLTIEMLGGTSGAGIWRGRQQQVLPDKVSDDERDRRLLQAVRGLLERFPPPPPAR
ncbi:MAG TPA: DUF4136 domain-containing protein [Tepidisphaeraceae bacterium]|jgi:hypothetical protein